MTSSARVSTTLATLVLVFTLAVSLCRYSAADEPSNQAAYDRYGGPFTLVDHGGRTVTDGDFRGKYMLVFFGYTFCPDVCPTDLQVIGEAMDILGNKGAAVQPIFITVDPERDTAEVMADYVQNFHPRLLGLTGTKAQTAAAAEAYGAVYFKVFLPPFQDDTEGGDTEAAVDENSHYFMSHSAATYLMGPDGRFLALFPHGTDPDAMAAAIGAYLDGRAS